jgi:hypothetical protein
MTTPTLPSDTGQLGPGELQIGAVGSEIDVSCYLNSVGIDISENEVSASTTKLCGAVRPAVVQYERALSGNVDLDLGNASGLFQLSWDEEGSVQDFTFTPSNDLGVTFTGQLVLTPLGIASAEYGSDLTTDFEFKVLGKPTITRGGGAVAATGATAGTPGAFTPAGATVPANLSALQGASPAVVASPNTAWTTGQNVVLGTGSAHWSGSAWASGAAS